MTGMLVSFEGGLSEHRRFLMRAVISLMDTNRHLVTFTDPRDAHPLSDTLRRASLIDAFSGDAHPYTAYLNPVTDLLIRAAEIHQGMPLVTRALRTGKVAFVSSYIHSLQTSAVKGMPGYYMHTATRQLPRPHLVVIIQDGEDDEHALGLLRLMGQQKQRCVVVQSSESRVSAVERVVQSIHALPAADVYFRAADAMLARDVDELACVEP